MPLTLLQTIFQGQRFVLLQHGLDRATGMWLYSDPVAVISAHKYAQVRPALDELRRANHEGLHLAGFMAYEAGHSLDSKLAILRNARRVDDCPLLWFGVFKARSVVSADELASIGRTIGMASVTSVAPMISKSAYETAFARAMHYISRGDIYQVNLSFPSNIGYNGHPFPLFLEIQAAAAAPWSSVVYTGAEWLLSCSPELFFKHHDSNLMARPMKGTVRRSSDPKFDAAAAEGLLNDPKQRAENLMIVDLLRNDFARIAEPGSVRVPSLFDLETYPTVHTLTSSITATLKAGYGPIDVLSQCFPCGSITGAPKIRAMEIIKEIEPYVRGAYTGSIGRVGPDNNAEFSVAIRTLVVDDKNRVAKIGLGSAIVADSEVDSEWSECLTKGLFLTRGAQSLTGGDGRSST